MRTLILRMFSPDQQDGAGAMHGIVQRPGGPPVRFTDESSLLHAVTTLTSEDTAAVGEGGRDEQGARST